MNNLKPLFGISIAILFIILGTRLIEKEDKFTVIVGYANIIFWSFMILFTFYKLATKKQ